MCYGSKFGLVTLVVSDQFFKIKRSWRFEERCTAVLFGAVFDMAVCAPDSKKDLDEYGTLIMNVTRILWEGRRAGAKDFHITSDFNVEVGLLCTEDDDNDELNEMYGPFCWQGWENDQGGFKTQLDHIVGLRRTSDTTTLRRGFLGTIIRFVRLYGKMKRRINSLKGGEGKMDGMEATQ